jgi:aminoglycoside phosphotransferase (APT) family kinase protein
MERPADSIQLEPCRTGKFNTTWFVHVDADPSTVGHGLMLRVAPPDDRESVLFYEHRMMRQEPELHRLIREGTNCPVPRILVFDDTREMLPRDFLIMERMPGQPLSDHANLSQGQVADILREIGRHLRTVHDLTHDAYGYVGPHEVMEPQSDWTSAFVIMWNKLLDDIQRCGGYSDEEADHMRQLLDRHVKVFDRKEPARLLHMDVWAQNIMVDESGRLSGLLDWDRALWGDPEIEFAVLDYCGISERPFWEGYGEARDESDRAQIRDLFYLLYELQKYIFIRRVRGQSQSTADAYRRQSLQIAGQLESLR